MINKNKHYCICIISDNNIKKYSIIEYTIDILNNYKKVHYFFSNAFNIINYLNLNKKEKTINFILYRGIEDIIKYIFENNFTKNSILIFDNISILNLEIPNNINYFVRLNILLSYIHILCEYTNSISIFIRDTEKEPISNLIDYWCDYKIINLEKDKEIIFKDLNSKYEEKILYEELAKWIT